MDEDRIEAQGNQPDPNEGAPTDAIEIINLVGQPDENEAAKEEGGSAGAQTRWKRSGKLKRKRKSKDKGKEKAPSPPSDTTPAGASQPARSYRQGILAFSTKKKRKNRDNERKKEPSLPSRNICPGESHPGGSSSQTGLSIPTKNLNRERVMGDSNTSVREEGDGDMLTSEDLQMIQSKTPNEETPAREKSILSETVDPKMPAPPKSILSEIADPKTPARKKRVHFKIADAKTRARKKKTPINKKSVLSKTAGPKTPISKKKNKKIQLSKSQQIQNLTYQLQGLQATVYKSECDLEKLCSHFKSHMKSTKKIISQTMRSVSNLVEELDAFQTEDASSSTTSRDTDENEDDGKDEDEDYDFEEEMAAHNS